MSEFNCAHCGALVMSGNINSAFRSIARRLRMKQRFSYFQIAQEIGPDQQLCDGCFDEWLRLHSEIDRVFLDACDDKERTRQLSEYRCEHCGRPASDEKRLYLTECFYDEDEGEYVGHGRVLCDACWDERQKLHARLDKRFFHYKEKESE